MRFISPPPKSKREWDGQFLYPIKKTRRIPHVVIIIIEVVFKDEEKGGGGGDELHCD